MGAHESLLCEEPVIDLSVEVFEFGARQGGSDPNNQLFIIRNSGGQTLNWQITHDCDWLDVDPCEGSSWGEANEVTLSVNIAGLIAGSSDCELTIFDSSAVNSRKTVEVKLRLYGEGELPVPLEYPTIQAAIKTMISTLAEKPSQ
jgi:hypothetical protein